MGVNRAPDPPRPQPVLSAAVLLLSTMVLACPPVAVYLLVNGDPQWSRYGLVWVLAALSPFVAVGVVRWFARTRAPLAAPWTHVRAAGLLLFHVVTGAYAFASEPLMLVPVSFVTLAGWVVSWKIIDLGRLPYRRVPQVFAPPRAVPRQPPSTVHTTVHSRSRTPAPQVDAEPRPGDIFWADVPLDDGSGDRRRPCVVVRSYRSHAYVLGISHARRGDTVRLDPGGWSHDRRPGYVHLDPLHKLRYGRFGARMGRCPGGAWNEILFGYPPEGDPTTPRRRRPPPPEPARRPPPPEPARPAAREKVPRQPVAPAQPSDGRPRRRAGTAGPVDPAGPPPGTSDGVPRRRSPG